ncbi:MAG: mannosyl-3-phosphoglycerate phosphatase [Thermodesulfovibrio sp.]|nr:mannosyl-3-phosphoglycerate phosphatase [Thermodesulfovibrio sp.]
MKQIVIFTDLDGTLLHPRTYSYEAGLQALTVINENKIPLILCSSKTRAEIEVYRGRLHNIHPFISENGGGIFIPAEYFMHNPLFKVDGLYHVVFLGKPYAELRNTFSALRDQLHSKVKGFGDMTAEAISELTGLNAEEAKLAGMRDFDEPFVFEGNPDEAFLETIDAAGLHWTQGEFYHVMGDHDKGKAVDILKGLYKKKHQEIFTIGLGDGFNDLPMLRAVDQAVLIQKEDGSYDTRVNLPTLIRAEGIGPNGWNRAIMELLRRML